jgi:ABC-2 type transport system permease protein
MKDLSRLLGYSLRRVRSLVLAVALLLGCFQLVLIAVARSLQVSDAFGQLEALVPTFARELLGPSVTATLSFQGIVCLGYYHLAVMGSLVALSISLATLPTSEVETGFVDLILSRPLARHWIITRSILVVILGTAGPLLMMMAGTWIGLSTLARTGVAWPSAKLILSLVANLSLLLLCWGGIGMAIGSVSRRRGVAGGLAGFIALTTFLLDYVGRIWRPVESLAWLSPFRYYSPSELLMGNALPVSNLWVLAGTAAAGYTLAYVLFSCRDISR